MKNALRLRASQRALRPPLSAREYHRAERSERFSASEDEARAT